MLRMLHLTTYSKGFISQPISLMFEDLREYMRAWGVHPADYQRSEGHVESMHTKFARV